MLLTVRRSNTRNGMATQARGRLKSLPLRGEVDAGTHLFLSQNLDRSIGNEAIYVAILAIFCYKDKVRTRRGRFELVKNRRVMMKFFSPGRSIVVIRTLGVGMSGVRFSPAR